MRDFWSTILIAVLVFYTFNLAIKLIFRRKAKKLQRQTEQAFGESKDADSEVPAKPHVNPSIGEYTDFEEIK